jgi:phosphoglycolate phosphatase-like HAD superfamily hydrolase
MHVLALDFDGVLCDSSREVFVVAVDTFAELEPGSELVEKLRPLREDAVTGGGEFRKAEIYGRFRDLLPLGNRAEDFGVALKAIDEGATIADQGGYDTFYRSLGQEWRDAFHRCFYDCRGRFQHTDLEAWLGLHLPYPGLAESLRRHKDRTRPAVATAKDARSVRLLLDELGLGGMFDHDLILDKETGVAKTHHLRALRERTGTEFSDVTFVDDKINHLLQVAELGVRPVLAGWGFNTDRERQLSRDSGIEIAELSTLDEILFKGE